MAIWSDRSGVGGSDQGACGKGAAHSFFLRAANVGSADLLPRQMPAAARGSSPPHSHPIVSPGRISLAVPQPPATAARCTRSIIVSPLFLAATPRCDDAPTVVIRLLIDVLTNAAAAVTSIGARTARHHASATPAQEKKGAAPWASRVTTQAGWPVSRPARTPRSWAAASCGEGVEAGQQQQQQPRWCV